MNRYHVFLLALFAAVWGWAAIEPRYPQDWLLENYLVFAFVPLILLAVHRYRLSSISCTLITAFMLLHVVGSHYTYSEVPFGFTLQHWFGSERNMYDRLVHFSFGLLLAYPFREVSIRVTKASGGWTYVLPLQGVMGFSATYEIIEWRVAERVDPSAGLAFLGAQGDVWDAQKDMTLAVVGAAIALSIVALIRWRYAAVSGSTLHTQREAGPDDKPWSEAALGVMQKGRPARGDSRQDQTVD